MFTNKFNNLSDDQKSVYASNKLEALHFFAHKKLQELELEYEGVIPSKIDTETLKKNIESQMREVEVLNYIYSLIEKDY